MAVVNWDDMEAAHEAASRPAPAGRYILELKELKEGTSKDGKWVQYTLRWQIADGPFKGKAIWDYLTFNMDKPNTISMARAALQLLGFADLKTWGQIDPKQRAQMVVGKRIEADVIEDEYNGRKNNKIKSKLKAVTSGPASSNDPGVGVPTPPPLSDVPAQGAKPVNPLAGI